MRHHRVGGEIGCHAHARQPPTVGGSWQRCVDCQVGGFGVEAFEAEVAELFGVDWGGGVGQRVDAGLRLRERDHLADVLLAREDRDEPVDADGEAGVRRRAEAERVEQEAEALLRVLRVDAEQREDALLHVGAVDTHRARAELPPVQHEVVRLRPHRQRIGLQPVDVVGVRHRERVVRGDRATVVVDAFEQREVDDPQELQAALGDRRPAEVEPQLRRAPSRTIGRSPATMQRRVAGAARRARRRAPSCSASDRNFATGDSSTPPSRTRIHTRPAAPSDFARSVERVELRARHVALALDADALDRVGARERAELGAAEHVGELDELHPEPHVGLVGAVALHRLVPRHPRDRRGRLARAAPPRPRRAPRPTPRRARLPGRRSVISTSSCMNSNWRSARRSSSRRQRAIWK